MALSTITTEWHTAANSITLYIIRRKQKNERQLVEDAQNIHQLFNDWANSCGVAVRDAELAVWCLDYIRRLIKMPLRTLIKAAKIDNLIS